MDRLTGHSSFAQGRNIGAQFVGLVEDDLEEGRGAGVAVRAQIDHGLDLLLGLSGPAGEYRTTQLVGAFLENVGAGGEVIREAVMYQIPAAEPGGIQHAGHAPRVAILPLHLIDRPRRSENPPGVVTGQRVQSAKRRMFLLQFEEVALPGQGQGGESLPVENGCRINVGEQLAVVGRMLPGMAQLARQLAHQVALALPGIAGFKRIVMAHHDAMLWWRNSVRKASACGDGNA